MLKICNKVIFIYYQVLYDETSNISLHSEIHKNKSGKAISTPF